MKVVGKHSKECSSTVAGIYFSLRCQELTICYDNEGNSEVHLLLEESAMCSSPSNQDQFESKVVMIVIIITKCHVVCQAMC